MTESECAEGFRLAEKAGEARGGWTTSRHYAVPTTDIPVHAIPDLLPLWNALMRDKLASLLSAACPEEMPKPSSVRVHDAFVGGNGRSAAPPPDARGPIRRVGDLGAQRRGRIRGRRDYVRGARG